MNIPPRHRIPTTCLAALLIALPFAPRASAATSAAAPQPGPALHVHVAADRHPISPAIYGMAFPDPALAQELHLPLTRCGGDGTTRYNWKLDSTNAGADWYFMAGSDNPHPTPSAGPDKLIDQSQLDGGQMLLTIPIIQFINSATSVNCSFPVSLFGAQQHVNPYIHPTIDGQKTDAGNGLGPDGKPIILTPQQILRINLPNSPALQRSWVEYLVHKFGAAAHGGVAMYELDNEPGGWSNTDRDVHPGNTGDDELVNLSIAYAAMIKSVDPSAQVVGPGDFVMHYQSDGIPGDGKKEHAGLGQGDYYLQQMSHYQKTHGTRILDYFDEHYYPMHQDGQNADTIIECTRSLWDPAYKEKDWYGKWYGAKDLIPSFHRWVDQYYPGTKVSISEYGWGDVKTFTDALAQADVLGIFGRERLDMACLWGPPKAADAAANAFRIYLNYDGKGDRFGDIGVSAASADQSTLAIYAAQRSSDHALTLVIINKTHNDLTSTLTLNGAALQSPARVFRYSEADATKILPQPNQAITPTGFSATFPARSITLMVVPTH